MVDTDRTQELLMACEEGRKRIRELCGMVNDYAEQLGLGRKVRADDWDDFARAAEAKARLRRSRSPRP